MGEDGQEKGIMLKIRKFKEGDYELVCGWWKHRGEPIPPLELVSRNTYILENEAGTPWVCLTLIGFSTPWIAWSAGLVSNPELPKEGRKEAVKALWDFVADAASDLGYQNLLCMAPNEKLEARYKDLGFTVTKKNMTLLVRELGG